MRTARCAPAEDIVVSGAPETLKIQPLDRLATHITVETAEAPVLNIELLLRRSQMTYRERCVFGKFLRNIEPFFQNSGNDRCELLVPYVELCRRIGKDHLAFGRFALIFVERRATIGKIPVCNAPVKRSVHLEILEQAITLADYTPKIL